MRLRFLCRLKSERGGGVRKECSVFWHVLSLSLSQNATSEAKSQKVMSSRVSGCGLFLCIDETGIYIYICGHSVDVVVESFEQSW
jgi:hypothetical protein